MGRHADHGKHCEWIERIRRRRESGLTVAEFCEWEGVSVASFYNWQKKLRGTKSRRKSVELVTPEGSSPRSRQPPSKKSNIGRMVSALSCKEASIRKGKGDIVLIGKSRMSPFVISFDWQRLRTSRTSTLVNRKQLSLATGRSVPRRRQSRSRAKPDQQSFVDAASRHQPLKASSLHRQPERKEAKRRMERSLPRRSNANSAVKLRAPSAY